MDRIESQIAKGTFNAKSEALMRKQENNYLNAEECFELAYSPTFNTVGCRWSEDQSFKIFNIYYPYYGSSELVTDWISVGVCLPSTARKTLRG